MGMSNCALKDSAQRPNPVTIPAQKAMTPMAAISAGAQAPASWIPEVEARARAKPTSMVRALTRHGAGKSLMLAEIAPSVAG